MKIKIKLIDGGKMPHYSRDGDACLDCHARIADGMIKIPAHSRCLVNLGFAAGIPAGYEGVIRPRSGLTSMSIDGGIGTIDPNYRGEVKACVINNTDSAFTVKDGDRICQLAIREAPKMELVQVDELDDTERGEQGFGSSGL